MDRETFRVLIKHIDSCPKIFEWPSEEPASIAELTNLLHPQQDALPISYSLVQFRLPPHRRTIRFKFKTSSDLLIILEGSAVIEVEQHTQFLDSGQLLWIPAGQTRCVHNRTAKDLVYLSCVEPAFKAEDLESLEPFTLKSE